MVNNYDPLQVPSSRRRFDQSTERVEVAEGREHGLSSECATSATGRQRLIKEKQADIRCEIRAGVRCRPKQTFGKREATGRNKS